MEISEKNRQNKNKHTIRHSNGAKSTARILEEMVHEFSCFRIRKNKEMDPDAEANLNALKALHAKEVEENGVDNLPPFEAFPKVMNEFSGYIRGLGAGPKPPKKTRRGVDSNEFIDEIQQLQQEKDDLRTEVLHLKSDNTMLREEMERMRIESLERENKLRAESIERERKMKEESMAQMMNMVQGSKGKVEALHLIRYKWQVGPAFTRL